MNKEWEDLHCRLMIRVIELKKSNLNYGFYVWTKKWENRPTTLNFYNYTNSVITSLKNQAEVSVSKKQSKYVLYSRATMDTILLLKMASIWIIGQLSSEKKAKECREEIEVYLQSFKINSKVKSCV